MLIHLKRTAEIGRFLACIGFSERERRRSAIECLLKSLFVAALVLEPGSNALTAQTATSGPIAFEEIAAQSGINFSIDSSPTPQKNQIETMVAGVALIDYDGDGFQDIFFANGAAIPSLRKEGPQYKNRLFHNNGDGTFTDVTDKAGVGGDGFDMGAAVGDFDNDGRPDLYVVGVTKNHLYHNNGDGTFSDVTDKAGVGGGVYDGKKMWAVAAAWVDYNNDGLLDLFVSNYVKWEVNKDPECVVAGIRNYCSPLLYERLPNTLYRNNGDGTFTDVSVETGIAQHLGRGMGVAIADYDGDGFMDIFVANDDSPNFLFHNIGGKRFEEVAVASWVAYNPSGKTVSGMGADFRDVNNDGRPDIWFTALPGELLPLYVNRGQGVFDDATTGSGLTWATQNMAGWSNAIVDLDNDGWKDLFVARSNVLDPIIASARSYKEPNAVLRNLGNGKFQDVSAAAGEAFQIPALHRGTAVGDLDNDGRMDVVVSVLNGPAKLLHNITKTGNHWILLQLRGTKSNRIGIGAQIKLTTPDGANQFNQVTTSVGYASSSDSRVHFGLGASKVATQIDIAWPSGIHQTLRNVQGDRVFVIEEPTASTPRRK
jgi:enediyne biosynthesis protein E4